MHHWLQNVYLRPRQCWNSNPHIQLTAWDLLVNLKGTSKAFAKPNSYSSWTFPMLVNGTSNHPVAQPKTWKTSFHFPLWSHQEIIHLHGCVPISLLYNDVSPLNVGISLIHQHFSRTKGISEIRQVSNEIMKFYWFHLLFICYLFI